ncbi:hypothetical protein [Methylobacterium sp. CM6257]|jgi:hypothetical protein
MARTTSSPVNNSRAASLAEAMATEMARAAHALKGRGDLEAAASILELARHNRIVALRLRAEQDLAQTLSPALARR